MDRVAVGRRATVIAVSDPVAAWQAAGLYDPAAPDADRRRRLLAWLEERGATVAQMVEARAQDQLASLAGDLALRPGRRYTIAEMAAHVGLPIEMMEALRRSAGFPVPPPDEPAFTEADRSMFEVFQQAAEIFSRDELLYFNRVVGASLRRIAEAAGEMFLRDVEAPLFSDAGDQFDLAEANLAAVELAGQVPRVFDPMFRAHLELAIRTMRQARAGSSDYRTVTLTIGFVDLSGFTSVTGRMDPEELRRLVIRFEATAIDIVSGHGGRLIKLIGDEVMFSTVTPDDGCAICIELVTEAAEWATGARAGLAYGPVIASGGDAYGETVNLAARLADIAVPGEVLVNAEAAAAATLNTFVPAGRRLLKGFVEPVTLFSLDW